MVRSSRIGMPNIMAKLSRSRQSGITSLMTMAPSRPQKPRTAAQ
jgi:hypothetical protein